MSLQRANVAHHRFRRQTQQCGGIGVHVGCGGASALEDVIVGSDTKHLPHTNGIRRMDRNRGACTGWNDVMGRPTANGLSLWQRHRFTQPPGMAFC